MNKALHQDYCIAKEVVREALMGNSDAKLFLSKSQQGLILIAIYEKFAGEIELQANTLSVENKSELAKDGKKISNRLKANANLLRYEIANSIRGVWKQKGEQKLPENEGVLRAVEIIKNPIKLQSTRENIITAYGDLARFFVQGLKSPAEKNEKKIVYSAKHTSPILNDMIPKDILLHYGLERKPDSVAFLLSYFEHRQGRGQK